MEMERKETSKKHDVQEREFDIASYIESRNTKPGHEGNEFEERGDSKEFYTVCAHMRTIIDAMDGKELEENTALDRQYKALIGQELEVAYYRNKIKQILEEKQLSATVYPSWFQSLEDAVFQEAYGFSSISNWIQSVGTLKFSPSCKIIGERIYYDINGVLELQKQTISKERRAKLRDMLLLPDPTKDRAKAYQEVYLADGSRVTIYSDYGMTKKGQDSIVFRKYLANTSTFEDQVKRHTIPKEAIILFQLMVQCGFNVAFTGPVKSAKTTMMSIWQSHEDPKLEGLCIENDPEIPLHLMMPTAPIMQLVPAEEYMDEVIATAKRSDAQYIIIGEARQGRMMNLSLEAANMGTRHCKTNMHTSETVDFAYDVADKVTKECGGDLACCMIKVAKSFQYIVNMMSLPSDYGQKRLKGLWEMRYDSESMKITMHQICKYRVEHDDWVWSYDIGEKVKEIGIEENAKAFKELEECLKKLAKEFPNTGKTVFEPPYLKALLGR
ncbi:hypothetical protein [Anaerovorax sp. IOR16]|uniref:hypothetical protein n=1 Tax=Anaerovorax sp. IOR16 TaxID=2773458 RepID=UPI0019D2D7A7|nr:hypothetical protein [Anaerovorax sp. IOR16]